MTREPLSTTALRLSSRRRNAGARTVVLASARIADQSPLHRSRAIPTAPDRVCERRLRARSGGVTRLSSAEAELKYP